ncbi:hypothetical protein BP00DRAFT_419178 [Aspergillus indologenus CBS 114.80]|uniref:Uncharacterized protein n=1 Tax=Aspergillus indologenus CBS 114.80 TaxID=1450541 RepID=A0A2V5HTG4_9EURO|nr:hypothetical protein BP00DRAFT_419178 [Aspergillus indologenus CBS 114.80]
MSPPFFEFTRLPDGRESWGLHALLAEQLRAMPARRLPQPPLLPRELQHYEDIPAFAVVRLGGEIHDHFAPLPWEQWTMGRIFQVLRDRAPRSIPFYGVVHAHHWVRFYRETTAADGTTAAASHTADPVDVNQVHTLHRYGDEQLIAEFVDALRQRHRRRGRGRGAVVVRAFDGVPPPRVRKVPFHVDQIEWITGEGDGEVVVLKEEEDDDDDAQGEYDTEAESEEEEVSDWRLPSPLLQTEEAMLESLSTSIDGGLCTSADSTPFSGDEDNDDSPYTLAHSEEPPVFKRESPWHAPDRSMISARSSSGADSMSVTMTRCGLQAIEFRLYHSYDLPMHNPTTPKYLRLNGL